MTVSPVEKHPLRAEREAHDWSIDDLASKTGLSPKTILRAEQGHRLNPTTRRTLCEAFDRTTEQLGLGVRARKASSLQPLQLLETNAPANHPSTRFRSAQAQLLEAARSHYEQMYRRAGGLAIGAKVEGFLDAQRHLANDAFSDAEGREVYRSLGGLVAVAGICAYDSDAQESAERHFRQALDFARAAGDRAFGAYVYGLLGNQALILGRNDWAVNAGESAISTAGTQLTNALRADLRATQAKAFARMADTRNAVRTMGLAEEAAAKIDRAAEPPETSYIQPGLIEEQLAETLRRLGDLPTALSYIERSSTMPTHARGQANRLVILTRIAVAMGDLDYAADAIRRLLNAAQGMDSQRFRARLRSIRSSIEQHRSSAVVRDSIEELDTRLALPL